MRKILEHLGQNWIKYGFESMAVLISILAAFALNNWNDERKAVKYHEELVTNLSQEFEGNLESLKSQVERLERKIKASDSLIMLLRNREISEELNLDSLIFATMDFPTWNPSTFLLTELKTTGEFKSLTNNELRKLMFDWEQHYENLKEWYGWQIDTMKKCFDTSSPMMMDSYLYQRTIIKTADRAFLESQEFQSCFTQSRVIAERLFNTYQNETIPKIEKIIEVTQ